MDTTVLTNNRSHAHYLHDRLFGNLSLLVMVYKPSDEFKLIFKKDMFHKSNKTAFQHVIHYLLTILNPAMTKEKLISWPPLNNIKRENSFRNEVLQYLNELNVLYEDANLPVMLSSTLLAPGGYKFICYMYKLSMLVMYEDLKKQYPEILSKCRQGTNEEINRAAHENLQKATEAGNIENQESIDEFKLKEEFFNEISEKLMADQKAIYDKLSEVQEKIKKEHTKLINFKLSPNELNVKKAKVEEKFTIMQKIMNTFEECKILMEYIKEHSNNANYSDLLSSARAMTVALNKQLKKLPTYTIPELQHLLENIREEKMGMEKFLKDHNMRRDYLIQMMSKSKEMFKMNMTVVETD